MATSAFRWEYPYRPSAAQRADPRYRRLEPAGLKLDLGGLRCERLHLRDRDAQIVIQPILVQHGRDGQHLQSLIARLVLLRHFRREPLGEAQ
jgi:hypothetical protein